MKKFLLVVAGIVVLAGIGIVAVFYFTSGLTETADAFFEAVGKGDLAAAREQLSEDFKASTDEAALKEFLASGALLEFSETRWSSREISGGRGELNGEVLTQAGGVIPLKMVFVKENDAWKIFAIEKPTAGIRTASDASSVPAADDQVTLIKRSMHDFALSVNAKDMTHFRSTTAGLWQDQFTVQKFNEVFGSMFDAGIDFTVLDNIQPAVDPVTGLAENGILILKGKFPTSPNQVFFEHKYIYEGVDWKLVGFEVNVQ